MVVRAAGVAVAAGVVGVAGMAVGAGVAAGPHAESSSPISTRNETLRSALKSIDDLSEQGWDCYCADSHRTCANSEGQYRDVGKNRRNSLLCMAGKEAAEGPPLLLEDKSICV